MEFMGCIDELIVMMSLDEHSCEDQIFVMVFVYLFFIYFLYS